MGTGFWVDADGNSHGEEPRIKRKPHVGLLIGQRVQMHAATAHWMRGDRYGEIVGQGRTRTYKTADGAFEMTRPYLVKLDKSGKTVRVHPENLFPVED